MLAFTSVPASFATSVLAGVFADFGGATFHITDARPLELVTPRAEESVPPVALKLTERLATALP
jgi:hypothetical protein